MKKVPYRYTLPIKPKEYLKQGRNHCGVYTVKGIMSALEQDIYKDPRDYHISLFGKVSGALLPGGLSKVLKHHRLDPTIKKADNLPDKQKLEILKKELLRGYPVILAVGNGYKEDGSYSGFKASYTGHWISLWGFDDRKKVFYLYDSAAPLVSWNRSIPIGNVKRTYSQVLRDWHGSFYMWNRRYLYISLFGKK